MNSILVFGKFNLKQHVSLDSLVGQYDLMSWSVPNARSDFDTCNEMEYKEPHVESLAQFFLSTCDTYL
jgi:surfactin synthase thioesterase subunit